MKLLIGKTAVITGGAGQIGYATAYRLAAQGVRVIALVRNNLEDSQDLYSKLPNQFLQHKVMLADITDTNSIKESVEKIEVCDILINAAGITKSIDGSNIAEYSDEIIDDILSINLKSPFIVIREFLKILKESDEAVIINITSTSMLRASKQNMMYGASKAGLEILTKYLARNLGPNIRVVSVCPGFLENPTSGATTPNDRNEKIARDTPLKRVGTGDDIAAVIESICTHMKYVNGSTILVDGGRMT